MGQFCPIMTFSYQYQEIKSNSSATNALCLPSSLPFSAHGWKNGTNLTHFGMRRRQCARLRFGKFPSLPDLPRDFLAMRHSRLGGITAQPGPLHAPVHATPAAKPACAPLRGVCPTGLPPRCQSPREPEGMSRSTCRRLKPLWPTRVARGMVPGIPETPDAIPPSLAAKA